MYSNLFVRLTLATLFAFFVSSGLILLGYDIGRYRSDQELKQTKRELEIIRDAAQGLDASYRELKQENRMLKAGLIGDRHAEF